jgi:periplasmic binding family protein
VCVLVLAGLFGAFANRPPRASAAGPRTLTATPATGLTDQVVAVHWTGFDPTDVTGAFTVTILQCKANPKSLKDCFDVFPYPNGSNDANGSGVFAARTQPDGTGTAFIEVRPALQLPDLDCSTRNPCSLLAYEADGTVPPPDGLPVSGVTTPLQFAPSTRDCPQVKTPDVAAIGEDSAATALLAWGAITCTGAKPLSLDYTNQGSPEARSNFLQGNSDVAITSMPASPDELKGTSRPFIYAPVDVTGVVIGFNATDPTTGQRITDMTLTPRLVAELIGGWQFPLGSGNNIFNDPEFLALNPGHHWPSNAEAPLLRAEPNADAFVLTTWLQRDAKARAFLDGKDPSAQPDPFWKNVVYPTDVFQPRDPNAQGAYQPLTSTLTNVRRLFQFLPPGDGISPTAGVDGVFGVLDAVTARSFAIPTAKLVPANAPPGTPGVPADLLNLAAAYTKMTTNPDKITKFADVTAPGVYPLVKVDYAMVPTGGISQAKAAKMGQFLDYVSGPGQASGVLPLGYVPLSADLVAQDAHARDAVVNQVGNVAATPQTNDAGAPVDQGSGDTSGAADLGGASGSGDSASSSAASAAGSTGANGSTSGAALASSARRPSPNFIVGALRDFLGGNHQLLLPGLFALGLVALIGGPVLTWRSRGKKQRAPAPAAAASANGSGP